jgi:hypothetical protein
MLILVFYVVLRQAVVIRRPVIAIVRVHSGAIPHEFSGGKSGPGTNFYQCFGFSVRAS